ncbi:MAG: hypothetical protein M3264_02620 [Thermoproteota archaeon]|nr:hypothetical protein [Thermoproteota archaeon]
MLIRKSYLLAVLLQTLRVTSKRRRKENVRQMLCYAQRYGDILKTGDSTRLVNIQSDAVRRHAMEALCIYSKYTGCYDRWQEMPKRYSLKWTNGNESLQSLQRFFNADLNMESMLERIKEMVRLLPGFMSRIIKFAVLVGLRPSEVVESVKLINYTEAFSKYYNA